MVRQLVLVPPSARLIRGAQPIGAGYPRDYTPAQMRAWADDLDRLYRAREQGRALDPRAPAVSDKLLKDPDRGIKGALLPDGTVDLRGGRHRAHYMMERGDVPVPVWVEARDPAELARFHDTCRAEVARSRPGLVRDRTEAQRALGRTATDGRVARDAGLAREAGRLAIDPPPAHPESRPNPEAKERSRERGASREVR